MKNSFEFIATVEIMESNLWGHFFRIPIEIAESILASIPDKRVVCKLNNQLTVQRAIMPNSNGFYFIMLNAEIRKKLGLLDGEPITVELCADNSKYGLPMPEEFQEVMSQDNEANELFHSLTPGKMRSLLYIAGIVKNQDKRIERALAIAFHLKKQKGKIDFKDLQQDLKDFRK